MQQRPVDHAYVPTIAGRCLRCQQPLGDHVALLPEPNPMTNCPADHDSITSFALLIGDEGEERVRCPFCHVQVEPRLATGEATGPAWGPGRGEIGPRLRAKLGFVAHVTAKLEP